MAGASCASAQIVTDMGVGSSALFGLFSSFRTENRISSGVFDHAPIWISELNIAGILLQDDDIRKRHFIHGHKTVEDYSGWLFFLRATKGRRKE